MSRQSPAHPVPKALSHLSAFTLVELSIVLVIIGLIVGGVLIGQDLIRSAQALATVAQIQKFNTAANTFYGKYGYLPGDITDPQASSFGFAARGQYAGEGDGNGLIQGVDSNSAGRSRSAGGAAGEALMFWVDLSSAHLIDGQFNTASSSTMPTLPITPISTHPLSAYLPQAKLGSGIYIAVWSGGWQLTGGTNTGDGQNYFTMYGVSVIEGEGPEYYSSSPSLTPLQAFQIDTKMDDGMPLTGTVQAVYPASGAASWSDNSGSDPAVIATYAQGTGSCYDNGNTANAPMNYSVGSGAGVNNCGLSFRFQ